MLTVFKIVSWWCKTSVDGWKVRLTELPWQSSKTDSERQMLRAVIPSDDLSKKNAMSFVCA